MSRNLRSCQEDWLVESIVLSVSMVELCSSTVVCRAFFSMPCLSSLERQWKQQPHVICPSERLSEDVDDTLDRSSLVFPPITISPHLLRVWLTAAKKELLPSWTSEAANALFRHQPSEAALEAVEAGSSNWKQWKGNHPNIMLYCFLLYSSH